VYLFGDVDLVDDQQAGFGDVRTVFAEFSTNRDSLSEFLDLRRK